MLEEGAIQTLTVCIQYLTDTESHHRQPRPLSAAASRCCVVLSKLETDVSLNRSIMHRLEHEGTSINFHQPFISVPCCIDASLCDARLTDGA